MNNEQFLAAYNEIRNGANQWYRHNLVPGFIYTDGVRDCATTGFYWLLDIVATEVREALLKESVKAGGGVGTTSLQVLSKDRQVTINLWAYLDEPGNSRTLDQFGRALIFTKFVPFSDFTEGDFSFYLAAQEEVVEGKFASCPVVMCLPSED